MEREATIQRIIELLKATGQPPTLAEVSKLDQMSDTDLSALLFTVDRGFDGRLKVERRQMRASRFAFSGDERRVNPP